MPDKEMSAEDFERLKELIEDLMEDLERLQSQYRGQTGINFVRPLRLSPRNREVMRMFGYSSDKEDTDEYAKLV